MSVDVWIIPYPQLAGINLRPPFQLPHYLFIAGMIHAIPHHLLDGSIPHMYIRLADYVFGRLGEVTVGEYLQPGFRKLSGYSTAEVVHEFHVSCGG